MFRRWPKLLLSASRVAVLVVAGCGGQPTALDENAAAASGRRAMAAYDTDGDGFIAGEELDRAASLKSALVRIDLDQDGRVTAKEITRLVETATANVVTASVKCNVTLDGEPLAGATVTFEPEEFLGAGIPPASGVTDEKGQADITVAQPQRLDPTDEGVYIGLYRVKISKLSAGEAPAAETIPTKYNTETILGIEVATQAAWKPGAAPFDLTTN